MSKSETNPTETTRLEPVDRWDSATQSWVTVLVPITVARIDARETSTAPELGAGRFPPIYRSRS